MPAPRLVLASASPRRRELLAALALPVELVVSPVDVDERLCPGAGLEQEVQRLAAAKALAAPAAGDLVLAADTLVALGDQVLTKPRGPEQALDMLQALRGREHRVATGVALAGRGQLREGCRVTAVRMRDYTDAEIARYVASGGAHDKAGAYAIQDPAFSPVAGIRGCYCNVVGLPLGLVLSLLAEAGVDVPGTPRPTQCRGCPDWGERPAW